MTYDAIVLGTGGVGSAAACELARRHARVLGIDRFAPPHDRGSSHGRTRFIRQAYFEHPDYVPLAQRSFTLWDQLAADTATVLYRQTGLLQMGAADGAVLAGVQASAAAHQLPIDRLDSREIRARFPGFALPDDWAGVFEHRAGALAVEACVAAHLELARRLGAELHADETVRRWQVDGEGVTIETDRETYRAGRLVIAAGAWAAQLLANLGVTLEVRRKAQYWFRPASDVYRADHGCPGYLLETPAGVFYGFPQFDEWGLKVACHSGGSVVADPATVDRQLDQRDLEVVRGFLATHLPQARSELLHHNVCLYTMSPDEHFLVDRHPEAPQVVFAAGLSGHGFKFAPVLGAALAEMALEGITAWPVAFLSLARLARR